MLPLPSHTLAWNALLAKKSVQPARYKVKLARTGSDMREGVGWRLREKLLSLRG